jgi:tRNA threonylcarbamoyladenosine biosynthesis protein TsaE
MEKNSVFSKNKYICQSAKETKILGSKLAKELQGGEVLLLFGNLGAGKTIFLQGLAQGLGVLGRVNSPTFNILKIYKTRNNSLVRTFCHIDTYRLNSSQDLEALGIGEIWCDKKTVTAIEWADKVKDICPQHYIKIQINLISENSRSITIDKE